MATDKYLNNKYNDWTPIKKIGGGKYLCRCSCGFEKVQYIKNIVSGSSKSCGHDRRLVGKKFGLWEIKEELGRGKVLCQCDCGTVKELYKKSVILGETHSCGCLNTSGKLDIINRRFGSLVAKEFRGNATWLCQCECGKTTIVSRRALVEGLTKSCGCKKGDNLKNTMMNVYGDIASCRIHNAREDWQIEILHDSNKLREYIEKLPVKNPTIKQLCTNFNVNDSTMLLAIHKAKLEDIVTIKPMFSNYELDICNILKANEINFIRNDRNTLDGKEIDIYLPDYKLGIEFNGNFWHSNRFKDKYYHQQKSILAIKKGIQLIHIFEYEWNNEKTKNKIVNLLIGYVKKDKQRYYARNLEVCEVSNEEAKELEDLYHLQGAINSKINIGLKNCFGEIVGLMTFGIPRYDSNHQYEMLRLCYKNNLIIVGGKEKMFKYFLKKYKPSSIISYCNISKFNGNSYIELGFKSLGITEPNYVWVGEFGDVKNRYRTQKHKLLEKGLGSDEDTEVSIMERLNYSKIYDTGNLRFSWKV